MYNKVIMIGNLTKDPEIRYTTSGTSVTNIKIAVNSKVKRDGEYKDDVLFIEVVTFGKQAENCSQYLSKGRKCLVDGRLQEQRWESEGKQHSKIQIIADTVRFLSTKTESGEGRNDSDPF